MRKWLFTILFSLAWASFLFTMPPDEPKEAQAQSGSFPPRWSSAVICTFKAAGGDDGIISARGHSGTAWQYRILLRSTETSGADSMTITLYPVSGDQDSIVWTENKSNIGTSMIMRDFNIPVSDIRIQTHEGHATVYVFVKD